MAEALEEANTGASRTVKDLFAGAVGGIAQVLIGSAHQNRYIDPVLIFLQVNHLVCDGSF